MARNFSELKKDIIVKCVLNSINQMRSEVRPIVMTVKGTKKK